MLKYEIFCYEILVLLKIILLLLGKYVFIIIDMLFVVQKKEKNSKMLI